MLSDLASRLLAIPKLDSAPLRSQLDGYRNRLARLGRHNFEVARKLRRRILEIEADLLGTHSNDQWYALLEACGNRCVDCGCQPDALTLDHIQAISLGGSNCISNAQPMCRECNSSNKLDHSDLRPEWVRGLFQ